MYTMTRRDLFSLSCFGLGMAPGWLARAATGGKKTMVVVFLRGAMDGLSVVTPFGDKAYAGHRPTLRVAEPLDLDGFFGLNPALRIFKPLWDTKQLAIVQATGSPDTTRSHFDAQDYMESGTPGRKGTRDGWLNRALTVEKAASPIRAVALGANLPRALRGSQAAVAVNSLSSFKVRDDAQGDFMSMYANSNDKVLKSTSQETFEAVKLIESINKQSYSPATGSLAYPGSRFGQSLLQIARLIKAGAGMEVAFTDITGWDTHINQAPQLNNLLGDLSAGLAAFHTDMGSRMQDIVVVTMSEFGRTARENGNRGTDHGHANCMFVLGGGVKGGQVHGQWPGLAPEQLYENRDLAITTDFRDVLGELTAKHLGNKNLATVFPGYTPKFRGIL